MNKRDYVIGWGMLLFLVVLHGTGLGISITQEYTNPSNGAQATKTVTIDVVSVRPDPSDQANETFFIRAYDASQSTTRTDFDISDEIQRLLDGRDSSPVPNITESYLNVALASADSAVTFIVDSNSGFSANLPIAIASTYANLTGNAGITYAIISSVANSTTLNVWDQLIVSYPVGSIVQQLKPNGSSKNQNGELGLKAKFERPVPPATVTVSTTTTSGGKLRVGWAASASSTAAYYDLYLSTTTVTQIPENWIPTYADATWSTSTATLSTGLLVTASLPTTSYYVYLVTKDASGQHNVNESSLRGSSAAYESSPE